MEQKTPPIDAVIRCAAYDSPFGRLILGSLDDRLCLCDWDIPMRRSVIDRRLTAAFGADIRFGHSPINDRAAHMLDQYFGGSRRSFDLPLVFAGSDFRRRVWQALLTVTYGTTASYSQIAASIGDVRSVRAVASAIAANPISIFVPCHRVILQSGDIGNYAGTAPAKAGLLNLEAHNANRP